jgi:hypothetical protein
MNERTLKSDDIDALLANWLSFRAATMTAKLPCRDSNLHNDGYAFE